MKAGNQNRVVLLGEGGTPWGVALGHDCKAEHEHGCAGLRAWLGVAEDAVTVEDALCRPKPAASDWAFVQHDDPKLATLLVLNDAYAQDWTAKRQGVRRKHLRDGEGFHDAWQEDDALATAYDETGAALAAFRPDDRRLLADLAGALAAGRLALAEGGGVGPILLLADRLPGSAFLQSIHYAAFAAANDEQGTGIDYARHPTRLLETCVRWSPLR